MKRKIDLESLPLKDWKKEATMFQDDYTAGAGTSWLLNVAKAENKMIWEMIRTIEEAPTLTPPNEPLTLEELRQMRGKPVWTVTTGFNGSGRWELVCDVDCEDALEMASCVDGFYDIEVNTYGSTWLAYRRPPEGEEET